MPKQTIGIGEIKKAIKKREISQTPRKTSSQRTIELLDQELQTAELINKSFQEEPEDEQKKDQPEGRLSVDIIHTTDHIIIVAPVAGVKPQDLTVNVTDDVISIRGKRNAEIDAPPESFLTKECFWGVFSRSIILPENIDTSKIKATFKNALLKIYIPKTDASRTRLIKIKIE